MRKCAAPTAAFAAASSAAVGIRPFPRSPQARTSGRTVGSNAPSVRGIHAKTSASVSTSSADTATGFPAGAASMRASSPPGFQVVRSASTRCTSASAASEASSACSRYFIRTTRSSVVPMLSTRRSTVATTGS